MLQGMSGLIAEPSTMIAIIRLAPSPSHFSNVPQLKRHHAAESEGQAVSIDDRPRAISGVMTPLRSYRSRVSFTQSLAAGHLANTCLPGEAAASYGMIVPCGILAFPFQHYLSGHPVSFLRPSILPSRDASSINLQRSSSSCTSDLRFARRAFVTQQPALTEFRSRSTSLPVVAGQDGDARIPYSVGQARQRRAGCAER